MDPISNALAQYHFERKPPHQEEAILKATGEDVKVEYQLQKVEQKTKTVTDKEEAPKMYTPTEKEAKMDNSGPLPPEAILETVSNLRNKFPEFDKYSDSKKIEFVADLMNGKLDDIVFNNVQ